MQSPLPHPPSTPSRTLAPAPQAVKLSPTGHTPRRVVPGGGLEPLTVGKSAEATAPSAALEQSLPSLLTKDVYNPASAWHRVTDGHRAYFSRPEPFSKAYLGIEWAEFSLDEPILDRLSVTLAVMSALRRGEERTEYQVFDSGRLKNVIFENEGSETLETSLGTLESVRVLRSNADGSSVDFIS